MQVVGRFFLLSTTCTLLWFSLEFQGWFLVLGFWQLLEV
jgi:hypothetical protein